MARRPTFIEMRKADQLQVALSRIDSQLGYKEVLGSSGVRFEVFGNPLGKTSPGNRYKKVEVPGEKLLEEMENLAIYYKITPRNIYAVRPTNAECKEPPDWLHKEGKEFWKCVQRRETVRGLTLASGIYCRRYGPILRFALSLRDSDTLYRSAKDKIHLETREHQTQEYIVWADVRASGKITLQAFRYLPTDERRYKNNLKYKAAMDFNRSMYTYVERRKMAPYEAYQKWITDNRRYHQAVLTLIAVSFAGPL